MVFVSEPVGFKSVSVLVSSVLVLVGAEVVGVLSRGRKKRSKYKYKNLTDRHRETE